MEAGAGVPASVSASALPPPSITRRFSTYSIGDGTAEHRRLDDSEQRRADWKNWGPYVSDRAWGTVREDYSATGAAWSAFPHDHARSRAYRWNEDGLGGFCNRFQNVVLSMALWNGKDPILKERLFGLSGEEGNHGEDVKEQYFYVDSTPTHSYAKMVYKYPQEEFPYADLVASNTARSREEPEYELHDALGVDFAHWDVSIEYAKADEQDILCRVTAVNRGPEENTLHLVPMFYCRNNWSWGYGIPKPELHKADAPNAIEGTESHLGTVRYWAQSSDGAPGEWLFTENETNYAALYGPSATKNACPYTKEAFHRHIINGEKEAVNPALVGTKAGCRFVRTVAAGESTVIHIRFSCTPDVPPPEAPFDGFDAVFAKRLAEADEFYKAIQPDGLSAEVARIQRQAFAGLLWSKMWYHFGIDMWLQGDPAFPSPPKDRLTGRNSDWRHLYNADVLSMPDCWEYPWYAAWDLAFHTIPLAVVDPEWAKRQLLLMLREWYMHPSGAIPAYEWNFGDVNPPVHAWACLRVFQISKRSCGKPDYDFLKRCFMKLLLNWGWWANKKDSSGRNLFEGGFLGLDNIGVFDRSNPEFADARLEQADATGWMAMFCLNMLAIALQLALHDAAYEDIASKFFEHFVSITAAINGVSGRLREAEGPGSGVNAATTMHGLWDDEDKFFYDALPTEDGAREFIRVKSFVGLIPMFAVLVVKEATLKALPKFKERMDWFLKHRWELVKDHISMLESRGEHGHERRMLSLVTKDQLPHILKRMFDPEQFLSPFGLRSLSKEHEKEPYHFTKGTFSAELKYEPAESRTPMFGGNSNWRGPVWFPVSFLMIESLQAFDYMFKDSFKVEMPTGSGNMRTLWDCAQDISVRMIRLFQADPTGRRAFNGDLRHYDTDPAYSDLVLFHEYFNGDTGEGLGASHQTGWTALVAKLIQQCGPAASTAPWAV